MSDSGSHTKGPPHAPTGVGENRARGPGSHPLRRRELLAYGAGLTGLAALGELKSRSPLARELLAAMRPVGNLKATLLRADDFVSLDFEFFNLSLLGPGQAGPGDISTARLVRANAAKAAYIIVSFQPQAIGEQVFPEPGGKLPSLPVQSRLGGPSRLAFRVPDSTTSVPFNDLSLLGWEKFDPRVVPAALPPGKLGRRVNKPSLRMPKPDETALELPWHLFLSPHAQSGWAHALDPVERDGRTELWHTRLGVRKAAGPGHRVDEADAALRTVRAIWATGFSRNSAPDPNDKDPIPMALTPRERWELVGLSADFKRGRYKPAPVKVDRLMLTSFGAWINSRGDWANAPPQFDVEHWTERGTMGREHYVRVVLRGFLFPFGHQAALIEVSERKIQKIQKGPQKGQYAAFLRKRSFIVVKQPEKSSSSRDMPFETVRIRTVVTPDLDAPDVGGSIVKKPNNKPYGKAAFWPRVGNQDFQFSVLATDADGHGVEFSTPLIFVLNSTTISSAAVANVCKRYEAAGNTGRRNRPLQGQKVAFAPSSDSKPGDTSLETDKFMLGCATTHASPPFRARMTQAEVRLSAVEAIKGPLATAQVAHHPVYLDHGFGKAPNKTESFLKLLNPVGLDYGADGNGDRCGGLGAPNMDISGISRTLGPTGGPPNAAPPKFNPADFLKGAKFLGIDFADVLEAGLDFVTDQAKVPKTVSQTIFTDGDPTKLAKEIRTTLDWHPALKADPLGVFEPSNGPSNPATMELKALFVTPLNPPGEPDFEVNGELKNFTLNLFGSSAFLILQFNGIVINARKGQKPHVDVDILDVGFAGPLTFVNQLKELMKSSGNGFDIDVSPTQVAASYTVGLPTTSVGVFTLANIAFTAGVTVPFTGKPVTARFAFCSREQPFLLTYTIFGGGGFFELAVGAHGIEGFKAALEFGAAAAIDLGVASGGVQIMAGVYFEMDETDAKLTGYVRLNGSLNVLGLITATLEFYLGMTYDIGADELWGQCTLTIEVDVVLFSASVSAQAEKRFAGGGGGSKAKLSPPAPTPIRFGELLSETEWQDDYVPAFAAAAF